MQILAWHCDGTVNAWPVHTTTNICLSPDVTRKQRRRRRMRQARREKLFHSANRLRPLTLVNNSQRLFQINPEQRVILAHGEVADIGHFNVDPTLDASRGVFSDFGWRQIIVASGHHDHRALSAIDMFELITQIMIDGVEVKVALEGFRALSIVVPG